MTDVNRRPSEIAVQDGRLAAAGKVVVFKASRNEDLADQAIRLFQAVDEAVRELGGWLIEDRAAGTTERGFARLAQSREDGKLTWERLCPVADGVGRRRTEMKLPYSMLVYMGSPCWAIRGHTFSIDVFNPANELLLPYESPWRLWQLIPWPAHFREPSGDDPHGALDALVHLAGQMAVSLDSDYAFGGTGLAQAIFAYRFAAWSDREYLKAPGPELKLEDMAYPLMVLRQKDVGPDGMAQLAMPHDRGGGVMGPVTGMHRVGRTGDLLLIRTNNPPEAFPDGNRHLGTALGKIVGRPYVLDVIIKSDS